MKIVFIVNYTPLWFLHIQHSVAFLGHLYTTRPPCSSDVVWHLLLQTSIISRGCSIRFPYDIPSSRLPTYVEGTLHMSQPPPIWTRFRLEMIIGIQCMTCWEVALVKVKEIVSVVSSNQLSTVGRVIFCFFCCSFFKRETLKKFFL